MQQREYGECVWCLNCGYAIVPHVRDVENGVWSGRYTCAVYCGCYLGRQESERHGDRRSMSLEAYERLNPGWRDQLREKAAADKAKRQGGAA